MGDHQGPFREILGSILAVEQMLTVRHELFAGMKDVQHAKGATAVLIVVVDGKLAVHVS